MYRILDEMDGKQARRTGNASPLGKIFDHGCDAFATGLQCTILAKFCQMGHWGIYWVFGSNAVFHFFQMEEYYLGGLFLPPGNPISDGSVLYYFTMIFLTIAGNEPFAKEVVKKDSLYKGCRPFQVIHFTLMFVFSVQTFAVLRSIFAVIKHKRKVKAIRENNEEWPEGLTDGEEFEWKSFLFQIGYYFLVQGALLHLAFAGHKPAYLNDGANGELSTLFLITVISGFLM